MKKILLVAAIGLLSLSIFAFGGNGYNSRGNVDTRGNVDSRGYYQQDYTNPYQQQAYNNRMPGRNMNFNNMPMNRHLPNSRGNFDRDFGNMRQNTLITLELMIDKYSPELAIEFESVQEELLTLREKQQISFRTRDFTNESPLQIRERIYAGLEIRDMYDELLSEYEENDEEEIKEILERILDTLNEELNFLNEEIE